MRYWTFDVCSLIADYDKNKKTLVSIIKAKNVAQAFVESHIDAENRGDWEQYIKILELREAEYQMYVDMVMLGMGDLPEIERLVLQLWLMEGKDDIYIIDHCGIKNGEELKKIKKISLTKFTNIVMPN